jgi:hypothetical protein
MPIMKTWIEFARTAPELSAKGQSLFYQFGDVGLAFLGTVRKDGGPRLHPVRVIMDGSGLYTFLLPTPKRRDLLRDPRYALHCFPADRNEDAILVTGVARPVTDDGLHARLIKQYQKETPAATEEDLSVEQVFEHLIDRCLVTFTTGHGDRHPQHHVWRA